MLNSDFFQVYTKVITKKCVHAGWRNLDPLQYRLVVVNQCAWFQSNMLVDFDTSMGSNTNRNLGLCNSDFCWYVDLAVVASINK